MKVAFLKASAGGLLGRLIDACSGRGGYCHVEIVLPIGVSFSAEPIPGTTYLRRAERDPAHWLVYDVPHVDPLKLRRWCDAELGCPYDFAGVVHFVLPCLPQSDAKWFCSEVTLAALQHFGLFGGIKPWRVSPNELKRMLDRAGFHAVAA